MADNDKALLKEAKSRFKLALGAWDHNRKAWLEDTKFLAGDQWPETIKAKRDKKFRPCLVVDKLNQYVRQVVNDGRQNRPSVKVRPIDDNGDEEVAEAFQGLIRHILDRSKADQALDTALEHAVSGGFGFIILRTEYAHERTFDQEICVKRIRNPLQVLLDPNAQEADGSDAKWGFVIDEKTKDEFKSLYPKAKFTDFELDAKKYSDGWTEGENVRVVEYFYVVEEDTELHLLADGTVVTAEEYDLSQAGTEAPVEILDTRTIPERKVKWCRLSGAEILEKNDWLGKFIPIIPIYGNERDIDGKVWYSGLIRSAKDAQRLYNFSRSAFAERVALAPKAPFIAAKGQLEGVENDWKEANIENMAVLTYEPQSIDGTAVPPPQRQQASDIPEGFARDMQLSEHDIQGALGMYNASLGERSNEKSGKAIMARERSADVGTFHYQDNQARMVGYLGRQLVDLAPKIYDAKRVVRLLSEDGTSKPAQLDPAQEDAVQKGGHVPIYNLNVGKYDVTVTTGPSYTTKRQEGAEMMTSLVQAFPPLMQFAGDLIVRAQDMPYGDELADRMKIMLPPPIQQAEQAKEGGQDPKIMAAVAPVKQALDQAQQQIQAAEAGIHERDQALQKAQQENDALKSDRELNARKLDLEMAKADNERQKLQNEAMNQPQDMTAVELAKLDNDFAKAKLDADTKVIVAAIAKDQATSTAAIGAAQAGAEAAASQPDHVTPEVPPIDVGAAILAALEGFTAAVQRPKVGTFSDGRQVRIE